MNNHLENSDLSPALNESPGAVPHIVTEGGLRVGHSKMKNSYYFSHDYDTRSDEKIKKLIRIKGMLGYGIFWAIIEDLYHNANALQTDYDSIAFDLHTECDLIKSVINDFDLFIIKDGYFSSDSVKRRLEDRDIKSEKARESANSRWGKNKQDANAMRTQCDSNAIKGKERKGEESKEKKSIEEREAEFRKQVFSFRDKYSDKMLLAFFNYWSEKSKSGRMKFEMQKTYEISKRLITWKNNERDDEPKRMTPADFIPVN